MVSAVQMQMDGGEGETPPLRRRRDRCPQVAWHGCFWYLSRPILQVRYPAMWAFAGRPRL
jgi:hypothetical protein